MLLRSPALFICANFLQTIGMARALGPGAFPFIMSVLSGYPMGAKVVGDLKRSGEITLREAKEAHELLQHVRSGLYGGRCGRGHAGIRKSGGVIAAAHYGGALVNRSLYTRLLGKENIRAACYVLPQASGCSRL